MTTNESIFFKRVYEYASAPFLGANLSYQRVENFMNMNQSIFFKEFMNMHQPRFWGPIYSYIMNVEDAPGMDGLLIFFFKEFWATVECDVMST